MDKIIVSGIEGFVGKALVALDGKVFTIPLPYRSYKEGLKRIFNKE